MIKQIDPPDSFRGPGIQKGMEILAEIKNKLSIPIILMHNIDEAKIASKVCDLIQIPAFLEDRQTW